MQIQESGEMYLETILILSKKLPAVRSIDISEYMNFSKPSVSRAIGILKKAEYVKVDQNGHLTLTETGYSIAEKIYLRHNLLTSFLVQLGVDEQTASDDACKIEHHISDQTYDAILRHMEQK
ncbi:MAG: metal-dependent transcriptional regulator [Clostridia bacterium]|nr:metal-dependent transcriptional regulator [Clostridia bacterium]